MAKKSFMQAFRIALLSSALSVPMDMSALAADGAATVAGDRVGIILSKLPDRASPAYARLQSAAGEHRSSPLEMTAAEMWSIAPARVEEVRAAAAEAGASVTVLGEDANSALMPMSGSAMTEKQKDMMDKAMGAQSAMGASMMDLPAATVMEYALTKQIESPSAADDLKLPLGPGAYVMARRTSVEKTKDGYIWHGTVVETGEQVTLLWWASGRLSGQVSYKGHRYAIRHMGGTMHGVIEMAPSRLPPEHAPMSPELKKKMRMHDDPLVTKGDASMLRDGQETVAPPSREPAQNLRDAAPISTPQTDLNVALLMPPPLPPAPAEAATTISLLVAYTKRAAAHYTDIEKDLIAVAVEEANQSFRNSQIGTVKVELVHAYQTDYAESGTHFDHVFRFADRGDGYMDEVHALRDEKKADIALLIVDDNNGCGLAAGVAPASDRAFAVVHQECAAESYSLAHEIGHLIGARHDMDLDDSVQPYAFGHGYVFGHEWRTMMSYEASCGGCVRLPIWSSPSVRVHGVPAGDAKADNSSVIRDGAKRVSMFR